MSGDARSTPNSGVPLVRRSIGSGVLMGIGVAGFIDETVFHQILHWHHFYDRGSADAGLVSKIGGGSKVCSNIFWPKIKVLSTIQRVGQNMPNSP